MLRKIEFTDRDLSKDDYSHLELAVQAKGGTLRAAVEEKTSPGGQRVVHGNVPIGTLPARRAGAQPQTAVWARRLNAACARASPTVSASVMEFTSRTAWRLPSRLFSASE